MHYLGREVPLRAGARAVVEVVEGGVAYVFMRVGRERTRTLS